MRISDWSSDVCSSDLPKGRGVLGTAADALGSAIDTFTGGYGDELAGAGNVVANAAKAAVGREEFAPSQAFDEGQAQFDRQQSSFAKNHGALSATSTGAGIIGGVLLPAARVVKGAGTGASLINTAATGALYGGISGARRVGNECVRTCRSR